MNKEKARTRKNVRKHARVRAKIKGTAKRPRLSVFRSNKGMYLQLIDDIKSITLASVSSKEIKKKDKKLKVSFELGKLIARKAIKKNIKLAVFDKGISKYHGRVKAVAEGAREGGLKI